MTLLFILIIFSIDFLSHCNFMAERLSEPQIMLRGRGRDGQQVSIPSRVCVPKA